MASRPIRYGQAISARHTLLAVCIILVLGCGLVGCDMAPNPDATTTPGPLSTPTATATPTLPALSAEPGWHSVLRIGYASSIVTIGGTFEATKPFQVVVVCEGASNLIITYATKSETESETFQCTPAIQQHGVIDLHPLTGQISVNVSADSGVVWQGLIEVQD